MSRTLEREGGIERIGDQSGDYQRNIPSSGVLKSEMESLPDDRRRSLSPESSHRLRNSNSTTGNYDNEREELLRHYDSWNEQQQVDFVKEVLHRMCHSQLGQIDMHLQPMLQRDFISALPSKGLDHIAERILSYLDAHSLMSAEQVCREWHRVIADGSLWKKVIEDNVRSNPTWKGLADRRKW